MVKIYENGGVDSEEIPNGVLCNTAVGLLNPLNESSDALDAVNPILSDFLPKALPVILDQKKLKLDGKIIKVPKFGPADYAALAISLANIANDLVGAYRASNITNDLTSRLIAKEWLYARFRSGFDATYMSQLINNGDVNLIERDEQIKIIAQQYAASGAICDFVAWMTINSLSCENSKSNFNYDIDLVNTLIDDYIVKSDKLYAKITALTGGIYDEKGVIGTLGIDLNIIKGDPIENQVHITGSVFDEFGNPVKYAEVGTNLNSIRVFTDENGNFDLYTGSLANNYSSDDYIIMIKTVNRGYEQYSQTQAWGDNLTNQIFTLDNIAASENEWRLVKIEFDSHKDGSIDEVISFSYDADGFWTKALEQDLSVDFVIKYNAEGKMTRWEEETWTDVLSIGDNGQVAEIRSEIADQFAYTGIFTYNVNGQLVKTDETDHGSDDHAITSFTYDANGYLTQTARQNVKDDPNKPVENSSSNYSIDFDGNISQSEGTYWSDKEGKAIDIIKYYTWVQKPSKLGGMPIELLLAMFNPEADGNGNYDIPANGKIYGQVDFGSTPVPNDAWIRITPSQFVNVDWKGINCRLVTISTSIAVFGNQDCVVHQEKVFNALQDTNETFEIGIYQESTGNTRWDKEEKSYCHLGNEQHGDWGDLDCSNQGGGSPGDTSDSGTIDDELFALQGFSAIKSLNAGKDFVAGNNAYIAWDNGLLKGDTVSLYVLHDDDPSGMGEDGGFVDIDTIKSKNWYKFQTDINNDGSVVFNPVIMNANGNAYKILIVSNQGDWSFSEGLFTIK